jgi:ankyrin repeat protein
LVRILIKHGATTHPQTMAGKTSLSIAITAGHLSVVKRLIENDEELIRHTDSSGITMLMWACESIKIAVRNNAGTGIIEYLLKVHNNVNQEDANGNTAFDHLCMLGGDVEAAKVLVKHGARIITDIDRKHHVTSLMLAAMNGHEELCEFLMNSGCNPKAVSEVF